MSRSRGRGGPSQPRSVELLLAAPYHVVNGSYRLVSRRQLTYQNSRDQMWKLDYTPSSLKIVNLRTGDAAAFLVNRSAGVIHSASDASKEQMRIVWEAEGSMLLVKTDTDSDEDSDEDPKPARAPLRSGSSRYKSAPAAIDMQAARKAQQALQAKAAQTPPPEAKVAKPVAPKTTSRLRKMLGRRTIPPPPPRKTPPKTQEPPPQVPSLPNNGLPAGVPRPPTAPPPRPPSNPPPRVGQQPASSSAPLRRSPSISRRRTSLSKKQAEKPAAESNGSKPEEPKRDRASSSPSKKRDTLKARKRASLASASMSISGERRRSKVAPKDSEVKANGDTISRKQRAGLKRIDINLSGELAKLNGSYVANHRHLYTNQQNPEWNIQWHVGKLSLFKLDPHTQYRIEQKTSLIRQELPAIEVARNDPGHRISWKQAGDDLSITERNSEKDFREEDLDSTPMKPGRMAAMLNSRFATVTVPKLMRLAFLLLICWMFVKLLLLESAAQRLGVNPDDVSVVNFFVRSTQSFAQSIQGVIG